MYDQTFLLARQEQHAQDLTGEAQRERARKIAPAQRGLQCRLCLRIGQALIASGARLERRAMGGMSGPLGSGHAATMG